MEKRASATARARDEEGVGMMRTADTKRKHNHRMTRSDFVTGAAACLGLGLGLAPWAAQQALAASAAASTAEDASAGASKQAPGASGAANGPAGAGGGSAAADTLHSSGADVEGLGTSFKYQQLEVPSYNADSVDLTPNANCVVDRASEGVVYNGVRYGYDTASGATPLYVRQDQPVIVDEQVKATKMHWSVQPPLGIVKGEYYRVDKELTGGYITRTELVVDKGRIVHVELDEHAPADYYVKTWAGEGKRRSGYGFFQAGSHRTDETLVVVPNLFNYFEWQLLHHNSVNIPLEGIRGMSNSARYGFIPAISGASDDPATRDVDETTVGLLQRIQEPSGQSYAAVALPVAQGITAQLQLILEGSSIVEAEYDEIFADFADDIADTRLKPYARTSKRDSVDYKEAQPAFREFEAALSAAICAADSLDVSVPGYEDTAEWQNFQLLAGYLKPVLEEIQAQGGVSHETGQLDVTPAGLPPVTPILYRSENLSASALPHKDSIHFDPSSKTMRVTATITNNADEDVEVNSEWFFLYNRVGDDRYENIGSPQQQIHLAAGQTKDVTFDFFPVLESDLEAIFKYDGPNKIYEELGAPSDFK